MRGESRTKVFGYGLASQFGASLVFPLTEITGSWVKKRSCRIMLPVQRARFLLVLLMIIFSAGCNHTQQGISCAPIQTATLIRVTQSGNGPARQYVIDNRYHVQALVDFANGRRDGFSARRRQLPRASASATFFDGSQPLLTFSAGDNFFSLSCKSWQGVQEANRVQIAEFERLLAQQP